jgi:hypothetical protein
MASRGHKRGSEEQRPKRKRVVWCLARDIRLESFFSFSFFAAVYPSSVSLGDAAMYHLLLCCLTCMQVARRHTQVDFLGVIYRDVLHTYNCRNLYHVSNSVSPLSGLLNIPFRLLLQHYL